MRIFLLIIEFSKVIWHCYIQDEQLHQLMKKYKAAVQQTQIDSIAIADYIEQVIANVSIFFLHTMFTLGFLVQYFKWQMDCFQIADLEKSKYKLSEELHDRETQLDHMSAFFRS